MGYVAMKDTSMLIILYDGEVENPRTFSEPFGTMVCWHRNHNLGDEHEFHEPNDFLMDLVRESFSDDEIIDYVKINSIENFRVTFDNENEMWQVEGRYKANEEWSCIDYFEGDFEEIKDEIAETLVTELSNNELMTLAKNKNEIVTLYLYDHSGITMNTTGFSCPWDSGQVGYIYASHTDIEKEYECVTKETISKAHELLLGEVKEFDSYITGESYGFRLYQDGEEKESCWGFLGDINEVKPLIAQHLPEALRDMVNDMEYLEESSISKYEQDFEEREVS